MASLINGVIKSSSKSIAVIMAGGSGTRFWPLSRSNFPKQYLSFGQTNVSLIQETYQRVKPIVDDVLVVTAENQVELVKQHLPGVCILAEPLPRNTAACVAYAIRFIENSVGDATVLFVPADHKIEGEKEFRRVFSNALSLATANDVLVTIGIVPTRPETGYGYIKKGAAHKDNSFKVESFVEKPNLEKAKNYLKSGDYLWNSGVFCWKTSTIHKSLEKYTPEIFAQIKQVFENNLSEDAIIIKNIFSKIPSESIDTAVMEKADNVLVIPGDGFSWSDIGSWESWIETLGSDAEPNLTKGDVITLDSKGCGIMAKDRLIAVIGVEDLVIVDTDDAILVCKKNHSQDVKKVVEILKQRGRGSIT